MNTKLKRCPSCGSDIVKTDYGVYANCLVCGLEMPMDKWQSRPIEDTLQKKLDIAMEALRRISYLWYGLEEIDKTIDEIEKIK